MVKLAIVTTLTLIAFGHWWWFKSHQPYFEPGDRVRLSFSLQSEPKQQYGRTLVTWQNVVITVPENKQIYYGDKIVVTGTIAPRTINQRGNRLYLVNESFQVTPASPNLVGRIITIRLTLINKLETYLPADEAALAIGLVLGGSSQMSGKLLTAYQRSGLTHVVAASGYNVTLFAGWVMLFTNKLLHRKLSIIVGVGCIITYVFLAGATAAVIRAGIMSCLALGGLFWGRQSDSKWLLIITALGMWIFKPEIISDIGFQLTVAATTGLVFLSPKGDLATTLSAQVMTLPLILHYFGNLSVIAPLSNVLLLWIVPWAMQFTSLSLIAGIISNPWGQIVAWLTWPLLKMINSGVVGFSQLSFAAYQLQPMAWGWVAGYYLALFLIVVQLQRRPR